MKKFVKKLLKLFLIAMITLVVLIAVVVGGFFLLRGRVNLFSESYFTQLSKQSFEILLEAGENASQDKIKKDVVAQMNSILKQKKLRDVYFGVRFAERIEADTKTGKKPLVIPLERRG